MSQTLASIAFGAVLVLAALFVATAYTASSTAPPTPSEVRWAPCTFRNDCTDFQLPTLAN